MPIPDPLNPQPLPGASSVVFLKTVVTSPKIEVGEYSYYHAFTDPKSFESNVRYAYDFIDDKLVIGKFCAIAHGATFLLNGGNHNIEAVSTFPFFIFGGDWAGARPAEVNRGSIRIGHDVWIGYDATILPGVRVGHGAVIGAKSVVTADVRPYAVVAGNPAREVKRRFADADVERLLAAAWWDWPIETITANAHKLASGDVDALLAGAP